MRPCLNPPVLALALVFGASAFAQTAKKQAKDDVAADETASSPSSSVLFPDWNPDAFDFRIGPVVGFRYRQTEINGVEYETASSEIGLGARVLGIPLYPGNPGLTIEPYATYTWGSRNQKAKAENLDETESSGFQRHWYGGLLSLYLKPFRYSVDFGKGAIRHDKDDEFVDYDAQRLAHDFGLKILPFLSAHYTLTTYELTQEDDSQPSIEEIDHWIHGRIAFSPFAFRLDVGPGHSRTTYRTHLTADSGLTKLGTADMDYLKALASMHIFWKLGANASAKYILASDEVDGALDGIDQLPNENLNQRRTLASLPEGSLEVSAFFGLQDLFAGFGVGWQYYYLELKGDDENSQVSRDHGLAISYQSAI